MNDYVFHVYVHLFSLHFFIMCNLGCLTHLQCDPCCCESTSQCLIFVCVAFPLSPAAGLELLQVSLHAAPAVHPAVGQRQHRGTAEKHSHKTLPRTCSHLDLVSRLLEPVLSCSSASLAGCVGCCLCYTTCDNLLWHLSSSPKCRLEYQLKDIPSKYLCHCGKKVGHGNITCVLYVSVRACMRVWVSGSHTFPQCHSLLAVHCLALATADQSLQKVTEWLMGGNNEVEDDSISVAAGAPSVGGLWSCL